MVVKIQTVQMIAASRGISDKAAKTEGGMLSREGGSSWDDEDDYDE